MTTEDKMAKTKMFDLPVASFIKVLLAMVILKRFKKVPPAVKSSLGTWAKDSLPFVHRHKLREKTYLKLVDYVKQTKSVDSIWQSMDAFSQVIADKAFAFQNDILLVPPQPAIVDSATKFIQTGDTSLLQALAEYSKTTEDVSLIDCFWPKGSKPGSRQEDEALLLDVVRKLTGVPAFVIDTSIQKEAKKSKPDVFEEFLKVKAVLERFYTGKINTLLQTKKVGYLPVQEVRDFLNLNKINVHTIPRGFFGLIGVDGKLLVLEDETPFEIDSDVGQSDTVYMNKRFNGKNHVFKTLNDDGTDNLFYTTRLKEMNRIPKNRELSNFLSAATQTIDKVRSDLKPFRQDVAKAVLLEVMYSVSTTVFGSDDFGLNMIQPAHVAFEGNVLTIKYDNDRGRHHFRLDPKEGAPTRAAISLIKKFVHTMGSENVFEIAHISPDGQTLEKRCVLPQDLDLYLKSLGTGIDLKTFHLMRGTQLADAILGQIVLPPKETSSQVAEDWFDQNVVDPVTTRLNFFRDSKLDNNMVKIQYIHPYFTKKFFDDIEAVEPKWLTIRLEHHEKNLLGV